MKIFGREPAAYVGLVEGAVALALTTNVFHLSTDWVTAIMAALTALGGIYTAYVTKDTLLGPVIGLAKAAFMVAVLLGFNLTVDQTGAVIAAITLLFSFFQRTQTSPAVTPSFSTSDTIPGEVVGAHAAQPYDGDVA